MQRSWSNSSCIWAWLYYIITYMLFILSYHHFYFWNSMCCRDFSFALWLCDNASIFQMFAVDDILSYFILKHCSVLCTVLWYEQFFFVVSISCFNCLLFSLTTTQHTTPPFVILFTNAERKVCKLFWYLNESYE